MTVLNCPNCGGTHYGSSKCPYIQAPCVVCGDQTVLACSDCAIDSGGKNSIHVCEKRECRDKHEAIHKPTAMTPLSGPTPITDAIHGKPRQDPWIEAAYSELLDNSRNLERIAAEAVGALESAGCKNEWGMYQPCRHLTDANDKNWCPICKALARIKAAKEQI